MASDLSVRQSFDTAACVVGKLVATVHRVIF